MSNGDTMQSQSNSTSYVLHYLPNFLIEVVYFGQHFSTLFSMHKLID